MVITVCGREYSVEKVTTPVCGQETVVYILTGARGAQYYTCRVRPQPHVMFLLNAHKKSGEIHGPLSYARLTDQDGTLKVLRD